MDYKNREEESDELWDDSPADNGYSGQDDKQSLNGDSQYSPEEEGYSDEEDEYSEEEEYYDEEEERPTTAEQKKPEKRRRRFFGLGVRSPEERNDYFNNEEDPEPEPAPAPKPPKLDPEDPDYWVGEESDMPRMPQPRKVWGWWLGGIVVALGMLVWAWLWIFMPYVDEAVQYGYVEDIHREGTGLKTFEGVMLPYREIQDTTRVYREDFRFSVADDATAARLKGLMLGGLPARVEYRRYHISLPWRGNEKVVIVRADTADESRILPPEFR